ncbi:UBX domain-containing protein 11-like isoform X2 [Nilaparvata lugens]|uniref:UBX domain-containing protein 11-like isoform X2 n=1 Tax=Nilaparvata lugens TaxID=108931 RepID=UPI00193E5597|nr:UBX domain-containing protein 11-like isoform X2 [Nilaparvata lugens]
MTSNLNLPKTSNQIADKISELRDSGNQSKSSRWKEVSTGEAIINNQNSKPKLVPISFFEDSKRSGESPSYREMDGKVLEAIKGMAILKLKVQKYKKRLNSLMIVMKNKDLEISRLKKKIENIERGQNNRSTSILSEDVITLIDTVENLEERLVVLEGFIKKNVCLRSDKCKLNDAISDSSNEDIEDEVIKSRMCDESFDLIINQIKEMNQEAGEIHVYHSTQTGATFQRCNSLSLTLYANGFSIEGCQFRHYWEPAAQQFIKDIVDGYYPSEFQARFPRGIVLNVDDKRTVHFNGCNQASFKGKGFRLSSEIDSKRSSFTSLKKLLPPGFESNTTGKNNSEKNKNSCYRELNSNNNDYCNVYETHFCDTTIRNGEIFRKEKNDNESLSTITAKYLNKNKKHTSSTVQLKIVSSQDRNCMFMLTMDTCQTISDLQSYLPEDLRNKQIMIYKDYCKSEVLKDTSMTLRDYGIDKNALLILREI